MKISHIFLLIIGATVLVSCDRDNFASYHTATAKPLTVDIKVTGNGNSAGIEVNSPAMNGCLNSNNGCMILKKRDTANVTFGMSGNHSGFHITEIKLCMGAAKPNPVDMDCPLPIVNALDFYILDSNGALHLANTSTGKIEWDFSDNVKSFILHNRNLMTQTYYYVVTACNAGAHCPKTDPILDNEGIF